MLPACALLYLCMRARPRFQCMSGSQNALVSLHAHASAAYAAACVSEFASSAADAYLQCAARDPQICCAHRVRSTSTVNCRSVSSEPLLRLRRSRIREARGRGRCSSARLASARSCVCTRGGASGGEPASHLASPPASAAQRSHISVVTRGERPHEHENMPLSSLTRR